MKMNKKLLVAVICAFCIIIPVHATEATEGTNKEQDTNVEDTALSLLQINKENEYEIYKRQLSAQKYSSQIEYLEALYLTKNEEYEIARVKYELGYITEVEVKEAEAEVSAVELQKDTATSQLDFYLECIELRGGKYEEVNTSEVIEDLLPLSRDYAAEYLEKSSQLAYYKQQIEVYEKYLDKEDTEEEQKLLINSQLAILKLNMKQYEIKLKEYVLEKQLQYGILLGQIQQYDIDIAVMELKLEKQRLLYENGKVAKSTIAELEAELQQLRYNQTSDVCDARLILYELEHTIENQYIEY